MTRHLRSIPVTLAVVAAAALAAGCGSDDDTASGPAGDAARAPSAPAAPASPQQRATNTPTQKADPDDAPSPPVGAPSSSPTGARPPTDRPAGTPWCDTDRLVLRLRALSPAAGNRYAVVTLTNGSDTACRTQGYIGMQLLDGAGEALPTEVVRDHSRTASPLVLAPGASSWARLHWGAVPGAGDAETGPCQPEARRVRVTPPDSYSQEEAVWDQGPVCQAGRLEVLPLAAGSGPG
ncbi:hypothetical protein AQ490_19505 [Wenjunlia vitaminophila]|uniref:DUF4232 domain-containing protein n=1 Tax=Wenjunlia vitaminophila TaxID=76728 RepID=A0A0T6LUP0_WENVI|nr:DUF4232 domain-containing protein [Wenjunlia vitaminophila]KRV49863.1 hypothetical protein AQ490_19505 [Wenjunlia vitaminophila]